MDIETYNKDGKLYPYLLCWYDGTISKSYWIADFNNYDSLLSAVIGDLAIRKYRGYKIYLHNFSNFDGIFLLKGLSKLGKCSPIINDGKFISLTFIKNISKKTSYTLHFRDSYLILPSSLKNLCKLEACPCFSSFFVLNTPIKSGWNRPLCRKVEHWIKK